MPHMIPEIVKDRFVCVEGPMGTDYIPIDVWAKQEVKKVLDSIAREQVEDTFTKWMKDYTENSEAWSLSLFHGWGARLSAPGYLDCTEWSVHDSEKDARKYIETFHEVCSFCGEDIDAEIHYCVCGKEYLTD